MCSEWWSFSRPIEGSSLHWAKRREERGDRKCIRFAQTWAIWVCKSVLVFYRTCLLSRFILLNWLAFSFLLPGVSWQHGDHEMMDVTLSMSVYLCECVCVCERERPCACVVRALDEEFLGGKWHALSCFLTLALSVPPFLGRLPWQCRKTDLKWAEFNI